ncbi:unnamed protein product [marine sediment metagenome]|uniref:Uncharacterized protein n=1 Tax=marine sediment metagenome TaxID=412755 RepID=X1FP47_9ZZZZ
MKNFKAICRRSRNIFFAITPNRSRPYRQSVNSHFIITLDEEIFAGSEMSIFLGLSSAHLENIAFL